MDNLSFSHSNFIREVGNMYLKVEKNEAEVSHGELEPEVVLNFNTSLNSFSLDYSVHFFMPLAFFPFHYIAFSPLVRAQEGKNVNKN